MTISQKNAGLVIILAGLLAACQFPMGTDETPASAPTVQLSPVSTTIPTPKSSRALTVCLGEEPNTLYPLGEPNVAARSVLQAIYDGPADLVNYQYQPVVLRKIPSIGGGDALIETVTVNPGDRIVTADGSTAFLETGMRFRPADCHTDDCAITYDGVSSVEMDQMVVNFSLLDGLTWSDGEPLTADDSVYAFTLSAEQDVPATKYLIDRTQAYEATDEASVQWWGLPGFIDPAYQTNFWSPLPKHAWAQFTADELPTVDVASRAPIGWGPYVLQDWVAGDHLTLTKNVRYLRAEENLPPFDTLTFRIVSDPNAALSDLLVGKCDLLDPSIDLDGQLPVLLQMQIDGQVQVYTSTTNTIEWLALGLTPATYDDGYSTSPPLDRPDYFYDKRTRQAIAMCLDRQQVVDAVLYGLSVVPDTYLPPEHPLYDAAAPSYPFDPAMASRILEEIGWNDLDGNPATPRVAANGMNVPPGTPLVLNYVTSSAIQRRQVSEILSQSLAQCGIGVNLIYLSYLDFYADAAAGGPLFGRAFDLAQFATGVTSPVPPCFWYTSDQIPSDANHWSGANISGYRSVEFDAACNRALSHIPDDPVYTSDIHQTQAIFASDLPAIPLYLHLQLAASRPDLCNFELDPTASPLRHIEAFNYGPDCVP